jgi:HSP20 family protein
MNRCTTDSACVQTSRAPRATFRPAVDIIDTPDAVLVHADVPGARPETIDLRVEDSVLHLRAGVPTPDQTPGRVVAREFGVGDYQRSLRLGPAVDAAGITADLKNGVLTLRLPKTSAGRSRTIPVSAN